VEASLSRPLGEVAPLAVMERSLDALLTPGRLAELARAGVRLGLSAVVHELGEDRQPVTPIRREDSLMEEVKRICRAPRGTRGCNLRPRCSTAAGGKGRCFS
jgi:hypothetical protein